MKKTVSRLMSAVFAAILFAPAFAAAGEVSVFAAASLTDALKEIAVGYEKTTGDKPLFNFGASNLLARQIVEGAPADLFFSADEKQMDGLQDKKLLLEGSRTDLLSNKLVVVVPLDSKLVLSKPADLVSAPVKRLSLADPSGVPAGVYTKQYLTQLGIWEALSARVIPANNVKAALAAVEYGNADAAIVYKTDAALSKKVKTAFEVSLKQGPKISYPVAQLKDSKSREAAAKFLAFLKSKDALDVFKKYGFLPADRLK